MAFRPFGKNDGPSMSSKPSPFTPFGASAPTHPTRCAFRFCMDVFTYLCHNRTSFQFLRFLDSISRYGSIMLSSFPGFTSCQSFTFVLVSAVVLKCLGSRIREMYFEFSFPIVFCVTEAALSFGLRRSYWLPFVLRLYSNTVYWRFDCSDSPSQPPASQNHSAYVGQSFGPGGIQRLDKLITTAPISSYPRMIDVCELLCYFL